MSKDPSIPMRNKVNWYYVRDDHMFSTIKLVSRHQNTQQFGALLPIELTNEEIRNSNGYKEYNAVATRDAPPKPKASVRKTRSSSNTIITPPTAAAGLRQTTSHKGKQAAKASKAKSLSALSVVAMTEAQQLKRVTKRSLQQTHISQASGSSADEGTGYIPGVLDIPTDESEEELSWNSTKDEGEGKDGDGDNDDNGEDSEEGDGNDDDEDDDGEGGDDDDDQEVIRDDEDDDEKDDEEEAQKENDEFLKTIDENMQKIIKEQVKEQVKALVEAYESDKIILDTYRETVTLKRRRDDDADKDEEPSAGPDPGSKRRREGKEPESLCRLSFRWKSPHIQSLKQKPPTPDRDWNKTLLATHRSIQSWISDLTKRSDSCSSFNELMDTPLDFSNFLINRLKVDTLTPELIAGPTYELLKGSCKSLVELEYHLEEVYKATTDQLDWVNPEGKQRKPQQFYGFVVNRESARDVYSNIVIQRRVEDLQLGVESYQKKLNLTKLDLYQSDLKRKEAYIAYSNPRGFIYQNKDKKSRLMRIDELHKFSDGTLTDVRTALDDRLKGIWMQYLAQSIWRKSDKDRAVAMIQDIDKRLKTKRIMRSLERFVGGRLYEGDFRMLERSI
nr:hypothetical protein [Tanacetum cinerariifolium]